MRLIFVKSSLIVPLIKSFLVDSEKAISTSEGRGDRFWIYSFDLNPLSLEWKYIFIFYSCSNHSN